MEVEPSRLGQNRVRLAQSLVG